MANSNLVLCLFSHFVFFFRICFDLVTLVIAVETDADLHLRDRDSAGTGAEAGAMIIN